MSEVLSSYEIAHSLLKIQAISIAPSKEEAFTYASGLRGPIYCDNRKIISHVSLREGVCAAFCQLIRQKQYPIDAVAGTATAGIPHAAWIAQALSLPLLYVRSSSKSHGTKKLVEGDFHNGQKLILIEDLVTTGGSALQAIQTLRDSQLIPLACLSIFDYFNPGVKDKFDQISVEFESLVKLDELLKVGKESGLVDDFQAKTVLEWRESPKAWWEGR